MEKSAKIFIAGHKGMVGSAIWKNLKKNGFTNFFLRSSQELDLSNQKAVESFFKKEKPEYVFLAAAKVGGIKANNKFRAEFIYNNLQIQNNIIHQSYLSGVKKLLFLGSSCIYPRDSQQPMKEEYLLTGELEKTNEPYAIAKISGIKMCESYNMQYGTNFVSIMPTNLYGPNDNFDLETSHVLPALIRKIHLGKLLEETELERIKNIVYADHFKNETNNNEPEKIEKILERFGITASKNFKTEKSSFQPVSISLWGTGEPLREFLHVDDLAEACSFVMNDIDSNYLIENKITHINIGSNDEIKIKELAQLIKNIIGFKGQLKFDNSKLDGTPRKLLDSSRLIKCGWEKSIQLNEGIISTYDWYRRRSL